MPLLGNKFGSRRIFSWLFVRKKFISIFIFGRFNGDLSFCFTRNSNWYRSNRSVEHSANKLHLWFHGYNFIWLYRKIYGSGGKNYRFNLFSDPHLHGRGSSNCRIQLAAQTILCGYPPGETRDYSRMVSWIYFLLKGS